MFALAKNGHMTLKNRNLLKLLDFSAEEIIYLLDLSESLKRAKESKTEEQFLKNRNIALIFEKTSTRTRCAFEVACYDQGAHVTFLGPGETQIGHKETMKDTARVLGKMYDGIQYRGFSQDTVEELGRYAGVPVWNGLTDQFHPTQVLADLLTMREFSNKDLSDIKFCYLGDARNNMANSLLSGAAITGMDFRIAAPPEYTPSDQLREQCKQISQKSGAKVLITSNIDEAVENCDFLYTDVWVSMGEPKELWAERIGKLMPYSVTEKIMKMTKNPNVKFLHCLPAFHNRFTKAGEEIFRNFGIESMEVTDDVFESDASVVFEQAGNRLHTIKAVMVATLT
jgi:ornithine carbamoyltransferase